jgi:hypothetical protein
LSVLAIQNGFERSVQGDIVVTEKPKYELGDIVKLKKPHPCGSQEWEILRVGADFRLKCLGCGHQVMVARKMVEKNTRGLRKP